MIVANGATPFVARLTDNAGSYAAGSFLDCEPVLTLKVEMKTKGRCFNIYAGPGVGKTTAMLSVVAELKHRGINVEIVPEYSKELIWHEMEFVQENIFAVQAKRIAIAAKTEFIVTDSPLLQQLVYVEDAELRKKIVDEYHQYENINIYLIRSEEISYDPSGRYVDEATSRVVDQEILDLLDGNDIAYSTHRYQGRQTIPYLINVLVESGWIAER